MTGPSPDPVRFWVIVATDQIPALMANVPVGWLSVKPQPVELAVGITAVKVLDVFAPERVRDHLVDVTLVRGEDGRVRVSEYTNVNASFVYAMGGR